MIFYNFIIQLLFSLSGVYSLFSSKAKKWISGRKYQKLPNLRNENVIWMHCSSLGEFEQGRSVFEKLKEILKDRIFVLTFFSPSGYEFIIKKEKNIADHIRYLPVDLPGNVNEFLDNINPEVCIFVKYDFWYNFLHEINNRKIKIIFISVLLNNNHSIFSFFFRAVLTELKKINKIFTQDTFTRQLLISKGFKNVEVAGDNRIDRVIEIANQNFNDKIIDDFTKTEKPVFICGSTWSEDIKILSKNENFLTKNYRLIIAPHELSDKTFAFIDSEFSNSKLCYYTKYEFGTDAQILILDTVGLLKYIYRYGKIAYVGGGFGSGIHSTLEPGAYNIPVIFGPKYKKFIEATTLVEQNAYFHISDEKELKTVVSKINNEEFYKVSIDKIKQYFNNNKNASDKVVSYILNIENE